MLHRRLWTQSRGRAHRRCRMMEHLRYDERLRKRTDFQSAMWGGTVFHKALEVWWDPEVPRLEKAARAKAAVAGLSADAFEEMRMRVIIEQYDARWSPHIDRWEVLGIEMQGVAPLLNPETGRQSLTWMLAGKFDVLVREISSGRIYIIEHKLTSEDIDSPETEYWVKLKMDPQISQYYCIAMTLGYDVYGVVYDVAKKTRHRGITINAQAKRRESFYESDYALQLRSNERAPLKRKAKETDEEYADRLKNRPLLKRKVVEGESDEEWNARAPRPETPEEFYERLTKVYEENREVYFRRKSIARSDESLTDFLRDTWIDAMISRQATNHNSHPHNPDACSTFYGNCEYFRHCAYGEDLLQNPDFEVVEWAHPELDPKELFGDDADEREEQQVARDDSQGEEGRS